MVAPYTPYVKARTVLWYNSKYSAKKSDFYATGVKQKLPFVNTAYSGSYTWSDTYDRGWGNNVYRDAVRDNSMAIATNTARKRMVDKLGDTSSIGATLTAERRETYGMLKSAVVTVFQTARAVKKGELVKAARLLGIAPPEVKETVRRSFSRGKGRKRKLVKIRKTYLTLPDGRQIAKSAANKWLWWSYGVKPLMGDCYNSVDVLQREPPSMRIEGSGTGTSSNTEPDPDYVITNTCKSRVRCAVNIRLKNPNLYLANQLGLVNPVQWINEAVMFSFVIDWFSNLSQVISQMTDFVGLETSDPLTSSMSVQTNSYVNRPGKAFYRKVIHRKDFKRSLTIPTAKLRFAYERFQWQRGANAISLLVGFLKTAHK